MWSGTVTFTESICWDQGLTTVILKNEESRTGLKYFLSILKGNPSDFMRIINPAPPNTVQYSRKVQGGTSISIIFKTGQANPHTRLSAIRREKPIHQDLLGEDFLFVFKRADCEINPDLLWITFFVDLPILEDLLLLEKSMP